MAITPSAKKEKHMKTKLILAAALIGTATLSAQAGVHFGFTSFGLPLPPIPVITVRQPAPVVYAAPAPVYVAPDACAAPAVVVAQPACPGPDYVWVDGYWGVRDNHRVWVGGRWDHRPVTVSYYDRFHGYDGYRHDNDRGRDGYRGRDFDRAGDHDRGHDHDGYRR
jgi:hypothetical protein